MLPLNMVMPAVKRPAAMGLSRAIKSATEWTSYKIRSAGEHAVRTQSKIQVEGGRHAW